MVDVKRDPPRPAVSLRAERAAVTRRRITMAARRLFARNGYGATTLKEVASEAGVAVQTVYAVYGSKAGILEALREEALHQPEAEALVREATEQPSPVRCLELFARSIRRRWELAGDIVAIHRDAATTDPAVREGVERVLGIRRAGMAGLARTLGGDLRDGMDVTRATAILDALTLPEVYAELVDVQGWTPDEYEAWLAAALVRELLEA
jgi:AcrR family transcriptional regulator